MQTQIPDERRFIKRPRWLPFARALERQRPWSNVARDDLAPVNTPRFSTGINAQLLVLNNVLAAFKTALQLARRPVVIVATVAERWWLQDAHKTGSHSESQNQVVIFEVDRLRAKSADVKKRVASNKRHSRTNKAVAITR